MSIAENFLKVRGALPAGVTLVAVSKTHPSSSVAAAYRAGARHFGENRPQEMAAKRAELAEFDDIRWHQIGHLQTNKVKSIAPFVHLIHSVDPARLATEISRRALEAGRVIDCLIEIRIAREATKHGWEWDELVAWLDGGEWRELAGVRFRGVMGIATFTDSREVVSVEFRRLADYRRELAARFFGDTHGPGGSHFDTLSMGMSDDFELALAAGSTMVRVGSAVFGPRGPHGDGVNS